MRKVARIMCAVGAALAVASSGTISAFAAVPPIGQGYPIYGLYKTCSAAEEAGMKLPDWHFGETARRYTGDGVIQFTNTTDQTVPYTATIETGMNLKISSNAAGSLPSNWNTTAKSDIGLKLSNGWIEGETVGPVNLKPGQSLRVEYGVVEKDFISMFLSCDRGFIENDPNADVIRGTGPAERYAYATIIDADGSVSDLALDIPARAQGANSKPVEGNYTTTSGPSLEKVADPKRDIIEKPITEPYRDPSWPNLGDQCTGKDRSWYPLDIEAVRPTFRKAGYSQDFLNWSKGDYTYKPLTDTVVGAEYNGYMNYNDNFGRLPDGWLESVGAINRAYMPVATELKPVDLKAGERVRVEYGTTMLRINYREVSCGRSGKYDLVSNYRQSSAPVGFYAEATVTSPDGSTRVIDITPEGWAHLPVPTQTIR